MADEPETLDEEEILPPPTAEEASAFAEKLLTLQARCEAAKIEFSQDEDEEGDRYATIILQSGKDRRSVYFYSESKVDVILSSNFEKTRFISGYDAICSYDEQYIEVGLRSTRLSPYSILRRLNGKSFLDSTDPEPFELKSSSDRPAFEISPRTPLFAALGTGRTSRTLTLKLKNIRATQHDQALEELRSYTDSLFFQIDMMFGSTFILEREKRSNYAPTSRRRPDLNLSYPIAHYNEESMSLYWYAKSARDMPLLRFLAFYQSIEFYFPRYSQTEARKRVSGIIKNPTFRPHRDDDLDKLISAIQSARGSGLGSERSQLRSAVNECISAEEIRTFLTLDKEREAHFLGKTKAKYHKIPLINRTADLRTDVADRIYDIRCKIVHTKNEHSEDDFPMILPFSDDAYQLIHDIDLVEFVARGVLIASSGELN